MFEGIIIKSIDTCDTGFIFRQPAKADAKICCAVCLALISIASLPEAKLTVYDFLCKRLKGLKRVNRFKILGKSKINIGRPQPFRSLLLAILRVIRDKLIDKSDNFLLR
ncbi:hypothetical protein SDC9_89866 [bioreactor metagenome]|uniref:Uncharacterized protein n=1 Tax=bioreactor metagenome TaxID=1076179 RepID=A0A644ZX30_9ZZZZ